MDLPRCRDLDEATLRRLVQGAERVRLTAGDVLFREGDVSDCIYLVLSGRLERPESEPGPVVQEGDLVGVLEALSGEERISTVSVSQDAELLRVPAASLDALLAERPDVTTELVQVAERHLLRREMARLLPGVFGSLDAETVREMGRVFQWFRLARGEELFAQGDAGDALYLLVSGRLQARVVSGGGAPRVVGEIVPGETVGEMALVTGDPRNATIVALRDSVLQRCDRVAFEELVQAHPSLYKHLSEILVRRLETANRGGARAHGRMSVTVVPLHEGLELATFIEPFVAEMEQVGSVLHLDRAEVGRRVGHLLSDLETGLQDLRLLPWFEEQESRHDVVVYEAEPDATTWTTRCVRQADRIVLVADADHDPSVGELERRMATFLTGAHAPYHLVLLHPSDRAQPRGTREWLDRRRVHRHHHVRRGRTADVERVARLLTGRGLGLVLSGGGARGFAHIAVMTVMEELGIPIDAIAGTSAGAGLGSQYAMGHTPAQIRDINWREFVARKPFSKYTLPVYSLVGRYAIDQACRNIYSDLDVTDLWIPFFCTSCDIHTGEKVIHDDGPLWLANRATTSLPGIAPPVIDGDRLLVDGGVLDNIPEQEMKAFCGGRVIAVDVSPGAPIPIDYDYDRLPSPWWVLWNRLNPFAEPRRIPTLLEVMMRTATVSNASQHGLVDEVADLVLRPPVRGFGMLDFSAIDSIIEASMDYAREHLTAWKEQSRSEAGS